MVTKRKRVQATRAGQRHTIGYLAPNISSNVGLVRWHGVIDVAREQDVNLICFPGAYWRDPGPHGQANVIYDLVNLEMLDGLILGNILQEDFVGPDEGRGLYERFLQVPVISVRETVKGTPYIPLDNYQGMREAIAHLVEVHGYRRIAFLRGPEGHPYADVRYQAYTDALEEHGLPFEPDIVAPPSDWNESSIRVLLDERKLSPPNDFEVVVAVNDRKALDASRIFQMRGMRVPEDVAIVGCNDDTEARAATPPLTSVAMPFYEQGRRATEMLLALLEGEEVPEQVSLPARLVVRQSCGCMAPMVVQAAAGPVEAGRKEFEDALAVQREEIVAEMLQALGVSGTAPEWAEQLFDSFVAEVKRTSSGSFLSTLNEVLRRAAAENGGVAAWQAAISALRRRLLAYLSGAALSRADDLWHQARVMIGEAAERLRVYQALQAEQRTRMLREVAAVLIATFDVGGLMNVLAESLPRLGIPSAYLSLYENPESPVERSRLMLAYDENGRTELEIGRQGFASSQLVPEGMLPQERSYSIVVEPLYFQEHPLGFVLFEAGPREGSVYTVLRGQISNVLHGASLVGQVENRAFLIQTAAEVSRAASSILDPGELIRQVVELVRERFDLYYAGLLLVDQTDVLPDRDQWAYLQAGTGEAGQKMWEQKYRLQVGGNSMIGQCIASGESRIALDVGKEAVRFSNPLLPDTRSELALPLVSRGQAIGALTIQSSREAAFTEEDIAIFEMMASQLANTIENARLFKQTEKALEEAEADLRRYVKEAWSKYLGRGR